MEWISKSEILIVGLGLLGGSYAKALKRLGYHVTALARRQETIDYAVSHGIIDTGSVGVDPALVGGADAVIELPQVYALRPAQLFARGGVGVLNKIGADVLSFGCETDDAELLLKARFAVNNPDRAALKQALARGESYPKALSIAAAGEDAALKALLSAPNFLLALEYINEIERASSPIEICPVRREGGYHDEASLLSATGVRARLLKGDLSGATEGLPSEIAQIYAGEASKGLPDMNRLDALMLNALRNMDVSLVSSPDDSEGLINRVKKAALSSGTFEEALFKVKCKRYTLSRVRRLMMDAVLRLPQAPSEVPYVRLLGARRASEPLLRELKARSGGALTSGTRLIRDDPVFLAECRATDLWGLMSANPEYRAAGREFTVGTLYV